jgi:hypothetical protein
MGTISESREMRRRKPDLANKSPRRTARASRVNPRRLELGLQAALGLGFLVYIWQGIQPQFLYSGFGVFTAYPVFCWESPFLQSMVRTPGEPLRAFAALLAQTYRSSWLGALVIVTVLGVFFLGMRRWLRAVQAGKFRDAAWIPLILVTMIYNRYENPLPILLALGLSVWLAILYEVVAARTAPARAGVFLALFAPAYYLAGASALVFAGLVCLTEALPHRRPIVALVQAVLAGGGAFVLGRLVLGLEPRAVYTIGTPWESAQGYEFSPLSHGLTLFLYALVPGLVLPALLSKRVGSWKVADRPAGIAVRMLVVAVTAALCVGLSRSYLHDERALHYYARQRDWEHVIALAHRVRGRPTLTPCGVFDINRALAHQGRLGEELCGYPQDETRTLFLSFPDMTGRLQHTQLLELYLDLGCPNAAQKNAYELLDNEGPSPYVLEALVRIHLVKGQYKSAGIALKALQRYAGGRAYARPWQEIVADPARADSHRLLRAWRRVRGTRDYAVGGISFEPLLKSLLQDTPEHRLAFEYLMAYYLLKHQRDEFVQCLPLLRPLGYRQLPRQYAEALLVYSLETKRPAEACGWTVGQDVRNQFREFTGAVQAGRGDGQAVFDLLAPRYGGTYMFYSLFNTCGAN